MSHTSYGIELISNNKQKITLPKCFANIFTNPIYLAKEDDIYYQGLAYKDHPIFKKIDKPGKQAYRIYDDNKNINIRVIEHGSNNNDNIYKTIINNNTGTITTECIALALAVLEDLAEGECIYISISGDPSNESQINDYAAFIIQIQSDSKYANTFKIAQYQGEKGVFMAEVLKKVYRNPSPITDTKITDRKMPKPSAPPNILKETLENLNKQKQDASVETNL